MLALWKKSYDKSRQHNKNRDINLPTNVLLVKSFVSPVVMYGCGRVDYKESWVLKNHCFWTVMLGKTLESPLDCKKIQPFHPKGNQSWVFIWRTNVKAETPILWPPDAKSWLIGRPWCLERLKVGGEGHDRRWDGWIVPPTQWTWVWVGSGSWWTGRPGVLQSMGSQRVRHDRATDLNWRHSALWNKPERDNYCMISLYMEY